jgi:glycosyltransferase involved in cell wall biosynthesis
LEHPRITVVTPSYNQGQFLEQTISSVLGQQYPNLEYIIMDGGSTDESVEIIKRYEKHLAYWTSGPDGGQSAAINKGFGRATGDILCWLNSDDMYLPGALAYVAPKLDVRRPELLFGNCLRFSEDEPAESYGSHVRREHGRRNLILADYIIQPSSFWTREAWLKTGPLDESLVFGFDWDWFARAVKAGIVFKPDDKYLSLYRVHSEHKTGTGGERRLRELASIYARHAGPEYGRLFESCCARRRHLNFGRGLIRRLRLARFEWPLLKLAFPGTLRNFSESELDDIMFMI